MSVKWKTWVVALMIFAAAGVAGAGTTYVRYVGVNPGTTVGIPGAQVWAGVYNLEMLTDPATAPTSSTSGIPTPSFCVDVWDNSSTAWAIYTVTALQYAPDPTAANMGAVKARDIGQLLAQAYTAGQAWTSVSNSYAAAVQASVWEIINETSGGYGLATGSWTTTTGNLLPADVTTANAWLTNINNDTGDTLFEYPNLVAVSNSDFQDFAIVSLSGSDPVVPEPLTMASAFFAIGGLGAYVRRRTRAVA